MISKLCGGSDGLRVSVSMKEGLRKQGKRRDTDRSQVRHWCPLREIHGGESLIIGLLFLLGNDTLLVREER